MKIDELKKLLEKEQAEVKDLSAVNRLIDKVIGAEIPDETPEETHEEAPEETHDEATEEESPEETSDETQEETPEEDTEEKPAEVELSAVLEEIVNLRTQVATLTAKLAETEKALAAKEKEESEFIAKFKNLSVALKKETQPKKMPVIGMTNGIGEG